MDIQYYTWLQIRAAAGVHQAASGQSTNCIFKLPTVLSSNDLDAAEFMMASDNLQDSPKVAHTPRAKIGASKGTRAPQKSRRADEGSTMLVGGSNCVYLLISRSAGICT